MIRVLLKILQFIIILYLFIFLIIKAFFISQEKLYENDYPGIYGYSIYIIKNKTQDYDLNEYVITKSEDEYNENDYVLYKLNNNKYVRQIKSISEDKILLTGETNEITNSNILGKVIYSNKKISKLLVVFTHPITIIILIVLIVVISNKTYKRYS